MIDLQDRAGWILPGLLCWVIVAAPGPSRAADAGTAPAPQRVDCAAEIDYVASFLLANDAGVRGQGWTAYPDAIARRLSEVKSAARQTSSPGACVGVLEGFLKSIRKGHLGARSLGPSEPSPKPTPKAAPRAAPEEKVELRPLSPRTVYLRASSFDAGTRQQYEQAITRHQDQLRLARNLIIDVRRNGGGMDTSFRPLLQLLGPATYRTPGARVLVTEGTIAGWKAVLTDIPASEAEARRSISQIIDRMTAIKKDADRRGRREVWLPLQNRPEHATTVASGEVKARPERVWVLTDGGCGSSCEQFVLMVKQNRRVTLIGRPTKGALDASNVRPARTPSGAIELFFATTHVRRAPGQQIDELGIAPSVALPLPTDEEAFAREVSTVQAMAEGVTN